MSVVCFFFFFQAEDGIRDLYVTGVQTCALPILPAALVVPVHELALDRGVDLVGVTKASKLRWGRRSEEHTSELQSRRDLVCRLLLEKKKKNKFNVIYEKKKKKTKKKHKINQTR